MLVELWLWLWLLLRPLLSLLLEKELEFPLTRRDPLDWSPPRMLLTMLLNTPFIVLDRARPLLRLGLSIARSPGDWDLLVAVAAGECDLFAGEGEDEDFKDLGVSWAEEREETFEEEEEDCLEKERSKAVDGSWEKSVEEEWLVEKRWSEELFDFSFPGVHGADE